MHSKILVRYYVQEWQELLKYSNIFFETIYFLKKKSEIIACFFYIIIYFF